MGQVDFAAMRSAMVASQLRTSDVNDPAVIAAMSAIAREEFLPADRRDIAYIDRPIPLGNGRSVNPPLATGRLLTAAGIKAGDKVLLIGDETGYTAALLGHMGALVAIGGEGKPGEGHAAGAPYDVILIDGAIAAFPPALNEQLAEGGRVAAGLVERGVTRLVSGRKAGGVLGFTSLADIEMASVAGLNQAADQFVF